MPIDKSWTKLRKRTCDEFCNSVVSFCERSKPYICGDGTIRCPCKNCRNKFFIPHEDLDKHIMRFGFMMNYDKWIYHGEPDEPAENPSTRDATDEMSDVLNDLVENGDINEKDNDSYYRTVTGEYYDELFQEMETALYPGCETYSSLNFLVKLMHLKVKSKWTNDSFNQLLKLLKSALPDGNKLPESHYEAKKILKKLGLGYESIHVCKYDCALYWNENKDLQWCPVCGISRWVNENTDGNKVPNKVMRYFPLTPRLKRLYCSRHTAEDMRWHSIGHSKDEDILRHPVDGLAWKNFDLTYPDFARDPRNVRLGLAADGFNPFGSMSVSYSIWPVILTTYNLPPWKCMKDTSFMLTLLIPGPQSPGKDMDVFLRPLVDELNTLWTDGVETRDAFSNSVFRMRACLLWTVNDFPARSYLSGWSGQGYKACPTCSKDTPSIRVRGKIVYFGHRRFLPIRHRFRKDKMFNGQTELRHPPTKFTIDDIVRQLSQVRNPMAGKHPHFGGVKQKRDSNAEFNWRKKSIFYELPYWSSLILKHNIDVMHVENNVCENLLGTVLGIEGKSKDTDNARRDLAEMGIREELHLYTDGNRLMKPAAPFTLSPTNKRKFLSFLKNVKFPDGFASNLKKNVLEKDAKVTGWKSHDCHVIIQLLLPCKEDLIRLT